MEYKYYENMTTITDYTNNDMEELEVWTKQGKEHDIILAYIKKCGVKCGSSQCRDMVVLSMWDVEPQQAEEIRWFCATVFALEREGEK